MAAHSFMNELVDRNNSFVDLLKKPIEIIEEEKVFVFPDIGSSNNRKVAGFVMKDGECAGIVIPASFEERKRLALKMLERLPVTGEVFGGFVYSFSLSWRGEDGDPLMFLTSVLQEEGLMIKRIPVDITKTGLPIPAGETRLRGVFLTRETAEEELRDFLENLKSLKWLGKGLLES